MNPIMANIPEDNRNLPGNRPQPGSSPVDNDAALEEILRQHVEGPARFTPPAVSETPAENTPVAATEKPEGETAPPADTRPRARRVVDRVLYSLGSVVPHKGDSAFEIVRKCVFVVALVTLIASVSYILNDMVLLPAANDVLYESIAADYDPDNPVPPPADFDSSLYPDGIMDSMKKLYATNQDLRGYIIYQNTTGNQWLDIKYPVTYSGDNEYYLEHDFNKARNKNGTPFFDERNHIDSKDSQNKVLIVYGHNMASGRMFAKLNDLMRSLYYARTAPTFSLDTLYERAEYKVFSVMLLNTREEDGPYFDYLRTDFSSDADFMNFVANITARSMYDYKDVTVEPSDELAILSTCTAPSGAKFKDGRLVVVARKVRAGESAEVNVNTIVNNEDVLMPRAWYDNQNKTRHPFYTDPDYVIPGLWSAPDTPHTTSPPLTTTGGTTVATTPPIIVPTSPTQGPPPSTTTGGVVTTTTATVTTPTTTTATSPTTTTSGSAETTTTAAVTTPTTTTAETTATGPTAAPPEEQGGPTTP